MAYTRGEGMYVCMYVCMYVVCKSISTSSLELPRRESRSEINIHIAAQRWKIINEHRAVVPQKLLIQTVSNHIVFSLIFIDVHRFSLVHTYIHTYTLVYMYIYI